ncbi:hypothetical protein HHA02_17560 [Cobetia marina]|nr:hypothetical protein HHA02_17560 [Cobetia marina]
MTLEHQIGRARKTAPVQAIAEPLGMQILAQLDFRLRILALDGPHHPGTHLGINHISHVSPLLHSGINSGLEP